MSEFNAWYFMLRQATTSLNTYHEWPVIAVIRPEA